MLTLMMYVTDIKLKEGKWCEKNSTVHMKKQILFFFHLSNIVLPSNVVVRTSDTDCVVIGLGCKHLYDPSLNTWLEVGVQSNNSQSFINMNSLYSHFGETLCKSLPAYHAFTGCDYTASFCRRGKVNPLKVLEKDTEAQHALGNMACSEDLNNECIKTLERYLCAVYGKNKLNDINDVRMQIFLEKYW